MKKYIKHGLFSLLTVAALTACSNVGEWEPPVSDATLIYEQSFANKLGDFTVQSVSGDTTWASGGTYAIMSGYVNSVNLANEDWLISPEIDLTNTTAANLSFQHVVRYFTNLKDEATVWISSDYKSGLPSTGTWTQLTTQPFVDYQSWNFVPSGEISLTPYVGKKVRIAFKYISTATKAGTWEIQNVVVKNTEAVVVTTNYGEGTEASPYTVTGGIYNQVSAKWVTGTIVGYVWSGAQTSFIFGSDTCTQATNLLLADSANNIYLSKTLPVQLPTGAVRNALNLKDNKTLIGKKVKLFGDLASYFNVPGLKTVTYFELEDGTKGGTKPFDPANAIFYETFATGLGLFTSQNVTGAEVWVYNSTYKCAYITGFVSSQNRENEDWLISPQIDLTGKSSPAMCFDHVVRYAGVPANEATVWVSLDYTSGLPSTATWTQIPTNFTNASTWDFYNSGDLSLSAYANKKIRVAFKYTSTATKAGTWEMKNFIVK